MVNLSVVITVAVVVFQGLLTLFSLAMLYEKIKESDSIIESMCSLNKMFVEYASKKIKVRDDVIARLTNKEDVQ